MPNQIATMARLRAPGVRRTNVDVILDLLQRQRRTTRTELTRLSGLSKATVSGIVDTLLEHGFTHEVGKFQAGRGRSRVVLEFDPTACSVLGAQLDDDVCTVVLTDLDGNVRRRAARPVHGTDPALFIDAVVDGVRELRDTADPPVLGMGVGAPGLVDPTGRTVTLSVSHGWKDLAICDEFEARLGLPVIAANRAKVAALGEFRQIERGGRENLIYIFLGSGIVAGIVVNGTLYFGRDGGAGEIGHLTVLPGGPPCGCGNSGCLHTVASEGAILGLARARAREMGASCLYELADGRMEQLTLDMMGEAVRRHDAAAIATLEEVGTHLGLVVANLINTLNPQAIVIGGPTARLGDALIEPIRREARRRALEDLLRDVEIVPSTLTDEVSAVGAAVLFLSTVESVSSTPAGVNGA